MKQLYMIGIAVAVLVLLLVGLSKLSSTPKVTETKNESDVESTIVSEQETLDAEGEASSDASLQEPQEIQSMTTSAEDTTIVMKTNMGDVTIELFTKDAPVTAGNFLKLAQEDFYDGVKFHRVIDGFMIQGGDPLSKNDALQTRWGTGGPGYSIQDEFAPGLSNVRGTLSMANSGPNTGGSQFFINTVDNLFLDNKHAVFGRVVGGMEVVDAISKVEKAPGDRPIDPIVILDIATQ